jgi:cytoskeletal protein CcmA (bactofilin family)
MFKWTPDKAKDADATNEPVAKADQAVPGIGTLPLAQATNTPKKVSTMPPTLISEDATIEGNLISKGKIEVLGEVNGDIQCTSVTISESGKLNGKVTAEDVVIDGQLNGAIHSQSVTLRSGCHVEADIHHASLMIDEDAFFEGTVKRSDKPSPSGIASVPKKSEDSPDKYADDVKKYASKFNQTAVDGIVSYLGKGVLAQRDASLVSCSDPEELKRVCENFCKKKLALSQSDEEINTILKDVCKAMSAEQNKSRVTFYYLVAEKTEKLTTLGS